MSESKPKGMKRVGRWALRGLLVLVLLGVVGAGAFYWWIRVPPIDSDTDHAVAVFTEVMNGAYEREPEALSLLAGAIARDPHDARAELYFGLANLHGFLRARELPYAIRAMRAFEHAAALDPTNGSTEGWRAFFAYQAAERRGRDIEGPRRELLAASEADPGFTVFLAVVALADMPLSSGIPQSLVGPLEAAGDCGDGTTTSCRAAPLFPHGAEGYHATLGDLRLRVGDLEGAQREYALALAVPAAATWPFRDDFTEWVEGAPTRAERFAAGDDPSPMFFASGERACACCHRAE